MFISGGGPKLAKGSTHVQNDEIVQKLTDTSLYTGTHKVRWIIDVRIDLMRLAKDSDERDESIILLVLFNSIRSQTELKLVFIQDLI